LINAGNFPAAAEEFLRWNKITVNGEKKVLPGLTSRREKEKALFLSSTSTTTEPFAQENSAMPVPIAGLALALLPELIAAIPKVGKLFSSGSEVSQRNTAVVETVLDVVTSATKSVNAQAAIEAIKADPAVKQVAAQAIEDNWFRLTEAGGGGIEGARKVDAAFVASGEPVWKSPSFIVAIALLPLVYMVVGAIVGLFGSPFSEDVRAAIANGIVGLILGGLIGYYYGQTTTRNRTPSP
jgi:hypothetical protein